MDGVGNKSTHNKDVSDPYKDAWAYLETNNVVNMMQGLTASIVNNRPDDPLSFLVEELKKKIENEEKNLDLD